MNRGSPADWTPRPSKLLGFNEAPIHESGKFSMTLTMARLYLMLQ